MKTIPLTVRRVPQQIHAALKRGAKANHRSLNGETLTWLERQADNQKVVSCAEAADILMEADALLTDEDRKAISAGIEDARRRMNAKHLESR